MSTKPCWYALYTKPRFELKVQKQLSELGYETFCPLEVKIRQWSDRKKKVTVPLIRSYCFVRTCKSNFNDTLAVNGAVRYLYHEKKPAVVREYEIEMLKVVSGLDAEIESEDMNLEKGMSVMVIHGPFEGKICEYLEQKGKHKIVIRVEALNQVFSVTISRSAISLC